MILTIQRLLGNNLHKSTAGKYARNGNLHFAKTKDHAKIITISAKFLNGRSQIVYILYLAAQSDQINQLKFDQSYNL